MPKICLYLFEETACGSGLTPASAKTSTDVRISAWSSPDWGSEY